MRFLWLCITAASPLWCVTVVLAEDKSKSLPPAVQEVTIQAGDLRLVLRDNSESPKRALSGIDALFHLRSAPQFDAFDPDARGASAGLNFEHIISGHKHDHNAFSPRSGTYSLHHEPGSMSATLLRKWEDEPWKVSSRFTYTLVAPHSIDFDFRCTIHDPALFDPEKYAIFFFANYMHEVEQVGLNFRGINAPGGEEEWIYTDAPAGPKDWNQGGTYRHREGAELSMATDQNFRLNTWSYEYPRYTQPFYFGKAAHGMTLILMFDKTATTEEEIRFSLFKFKLQKHPRPAWDFQYVRKKLEAGKEYGFRGRLVWKKFVSSDDCMQEYQTWSTGLPRRP